MLQLADEARRLGPQILQDPNWAPQVCSFLERDRRFLPHLVEGMGRRVVYRREADWPITPLEFRDVWVGVSRLLELRTYPGTKKERPVSDFREGFNILGMLGVLELDQGRFRLTAAGVGFYFEFVRQAFA